MRISRYGVAGLAALALTLTFGGVAKADWTLQGQSLVADITAPPADKKTPVPITSLFVDVITNYTGSTGAVDKKATNTRVYFPKDGRIQTKGLPQCDPNAGGFGTSTTEAAKALCGPGAPGGNSQIGSGSAQIVGPIPGITAVVAAFNGTQPSGTPTVLLHSRTSAGTTTVLVGTIQKTDVPGFGPVLDVPVPPLPLGLAISDFKTTVTKLQLPGKAASSSAKKKKKKKAKQYYLMGTCSTGKLNFQAISTFDDGSKTTATATDTCKKKKAKKKKK
jgi:hypothetical protein